MYPLGCAAPSTTMRRAASKAVLSEAVVKHLKHEGAIAVGSTPDAYRDFFRKDLAQWKAVAKQSHIQLD